MFSNRVDAEKILNKIIKLRNNDNSFPAFNHEVYLSLLSIRELITTDIAHNDCFFVCGKISKSGELCSSFEEIYKNLVADSKKTKFHILYIFQCRCIYHLKYFQ